MDKTNENILNGEYRPLVYFDDEETFYVGKIGVSHYN